MSFFLVKPVRRIQGTITLPGDKSIASRAVIIAAITRGKTRIKNFPLNRDCLSTVTVIRRLGIKITFASQRDGSDITVFGRGLHGLKRPSGAACVGDSGTTLRLILGVLCGQGFTVQLTAGKSLAQRPMLRVTTPLRMMGAEITARRKNIPEEYPPITIRGGAVKPIVYKMPVASAQVKSAILLAGLYSKGRVKVIEPIPTRDHTERMLRLFQADIEIKNGVIAVKGGKELVSPRRIYIPGDISSASFFLVLASLLTASRVVIRNVSLNPSRMGVVRVLKRMGADIQVVKSKRQMSGFEPAGKMIVRGGRLRGTRVRSQEIPSLIDELPILMVAACCARGQTIFEGVGELRVKETDRIRSMSGNLKKMGAQIQILRKLGSEQIIVKGVRNLRGARVNSFADHRTAMSMVVAGMVSEGRTAVKDIACINKSFPGFLRLLETLRP